MAEKPMKYVKVFPAYEDETVRITWLLKDGNQYSQEYDCPPLETRKAREAKNATKAE